MNKRALDEKGFTLVEGIVAMSILSIGAIALITVYGICFTARGVTENKRKNADEILTIYDRICTEFTSQSTVDINVANDCAEKVLAGYPSYGYEITSDEACAGLYRFKVRDRRKTTDAVYTFCVYGETN